MLQSCRCSLTAVTGCYVDLDSPQGVTRLRQGIPRPSCKSQSYLSPSLFHALRTRVRANMQSTAIAPWQPEDPNKGSTRAFFLSKCILIRKHACGTHKVNCGYISWKTSRICSSPHTFICFISWVRVYLEQLACVDSSSMSRCCQADRMVTPETMNVDLRGEPITNVNVNANASHLAALCRPSMAPPAAACQQPVCTVSRMPRMCVVA